VPGKIRNLPFQLTRVPSVRPNAPEPSVAVAKRGQQQPGSIAILNVSG
jgi:hypothetical protein